MKIKSKYASIEDNKKINLLDTISYDLKSNSVTSKYTGYRLCKDVELHIIDGILHIKFEQIIYKRKYILDWVKDFKGIKNIYNKNKLKQLINDKNFIIKTPFLLPNTITISSEGMKNLINSYNVEFSEECLQRNKKNNSFVFEIFNNAWYVPTALKINSFIPNTKLSFSNYIIDDNRHNRIEDWKKLINNKC